MYVIDLLNTLDRAIWIWRPHVHRYFPIFCNYCALHYIQEVLCFNMWLGTIVSFQKILLYMSFWKENLEGTRSGISGYYVINAYACVYR